LSHPCFDLVNNPFREQHFSTTVAAMQSTADLQGDKQQKTASSLKKDKLEMAS